MQHLQECLIIDDDQDDQEVFLMCAGKVNSRVHCTTIDNGVDAVSMLSTGSYTPDYIFIDVNMPKMNGIECLRRLKTIDRLKTAKMFMYSTTSDGAALNQSRQLGADDFIIKPASTVELRARLSQIFGMAS